MFIVFGLKKSVGEFNAREHAPYVDLLTFLFRFFSISKEYTQMYFFQYIKMIFLIHFS